MSFVNGITQQVDVLAVVVPAGQTLPLFRTNYGFYMENSIEFDPRYSTRGIVSLTERASRP